MPSHTHSTRGPRRAVAIGAAAAIAAGTLAFTPAAAANAAIVPDPVVAYGDDPALTLSPIGTFETGAFDEGAAEIIASHGERLFVVNAQAGSVSVLDYGDPAAMTEEFAVASEGVANSVAVRADGLGIVAFEADVKTDAGHLLFFDATAADAASAVLGTVTVGALPDMVTVSPDGKYAVVANEGEPAEDFSIDPEGSVSVVKLPKKLAAPAQRDVRTADFHHYEAIQQSVPPAAAAKLERLQEQLRKFADSPARSEQLKRAIAKLQAAFGKLAEDRLPDGVRTFGPTPHGDDHPVSRNLEPEYITVDGSTAYVTLQEANAVAKVKLSNAQVTDILPLGFKDHGLEQNALDPSDRDDTVALRTYPGLKGMYMPDTIQSYAAGGRTYLVTANEGDAREWGDYSEVSRVKNLAEDGFGPVCTDSALAGSLGDADLGRLNVTIENGFDEAAGCYDELYSFGGRSFSIWSTDGTQVFDSGSQLEALTAAALPDFFNSNHSESNLEGRSDDKGPEPETVEIGEVNGRTYAFVGFERVGGIAVFDITEPAAVSYVTYVNNRDFSVSVEDGGDLSAAGDLGPEGIEFIPAAQSTTGTPLLAVGNEVSGTTTLFQISDFATTDVSVLTVNDFHGRIEQNLSSGEAGAAVIAGAVDAFEAQNPNTLFVSAGDNIGASTFTSFIQNDDPAIDALVAAGLDLGAVGNHEFDQGWDDLTDRVLPRYGDTTFGLGVNVYFAGTDTPALPEYVIEEVDGVRVGFIGTVTEQTGSLVSPAGITDIEFGDQLEAANRVAAQLTSEDLADIVVLLTHEGSETGDCANVVADPTSYGELIRGASAQIDAIVSGHTHQSYSCLVPVDATGEERPVIQAHQYGTTLGKLDIRVESTSKQLLSISGGLVPLVAPAVGTTPARALFPADPAVAQIVADAVAEAEVAGSVEVGSITADVLRGGTPAGSDRGVESTLGNLVADVYLWATSNEDYAGTPAQIGLMNPGGLRTDLLYGTDGVMTYRDVANVQPFANTLVSMTLTGAQLKSVLEEQWQPATASRPKLHLGVSEGFAYEYDPAAAAGSHILSMSYNGVEILPTDEFTVVTNSFLASGGDNFFTFADVQNRVDTGQIDLAATVGYFEANSPVAPASLGRAVAVAVAVAR
ncbi:choice-of-anchor I family protein [Microbacterium hibisci]|uniref:choice-of-anchor I family protein n=1 Tax=Microbacterium hibisci TaxID=2036000 RepID=UPI0019451F0C|nr:choice-of-anchor I family protein [Microbacterium hibisci]